MDEFCTSDAALRGCVLLTTHEVDEDRDGVLERSDSIIDSLKLSVDDDTD